MLRIFLSLAFVASLCTSCRSYKEVTMLADVDTATMLEAATSPMRSYRIKEKDNLYVSVVSSNQEMNRMYNPAQSGSPAAVNNNYEGETNRKIYGYEVDANGNIHLPLLGTFSVKGKTLREVEELIQSKSQGLFKDVTTKVRLLNYKVTVAGEVKRPGVFHTFDGDVTVLDAISRAEGITEYALIDDVLVLRANNGKQESFVLNLTNRSALRSNGFYLMPDDTVIVKPGKNKNRQLNGQAQNWVIPGLSAIFLFINVLRNR